MDKGDNAWCVCLYDTAVFSHRRCRPMGMTACQSCRDRPHAYIISNVCSNVKRNFPLPLDYHDRIMSAASRATRDQSRRGLFPGAPGAGSSRRATPVPAAADSRRPHAFPRPQRGQGKRERGQGRTPRQAAQPRSPRAAEPETKTRRGAKAPRKAATAAAAPRRVEEEGRRSESDGKPGGRQAEPGGKRGNRGGTGAKRPERDERTGEDGEGEDGQGRPEEARRPAKTDPATSEDGRERRQPPNGRRLGGGSAPPGENAAPDDGPRAAGEAPRQRARDEANGDREAGGRSRAPQGPGDQNARHTAGRQRP